MSRRRGSQERVIWGDELHTSDEKKIINCLMYEGKKSLAERIFDGAMDYVGRKIQGHEPRHVLQVAMGHITPSSEVRSSRIGGATYQIPRELQGRRSLVLARNFLLFAARKRQEKTMEERLGAEVVDAFNERGAAFKKREDVDRMVKANRAFAHHRWGKG